MFDSLRKSSESGIPGVLITIVTADGDNEIGINRYWSTENDRSQIPQELKPLVEPEISSLIYGIDSYDFREIKMPEGREKPSQFAFS